MDGRDGVRVRHDPLFEQLVHPAVGQFAVRPCQPVELEPEFVVRHQTPPPVLGVRFGGQQGEGGDVVPGDPGRAVLVEHVRAVPQPQRRTIVAVHQAHPQDHVLVEVAVAAARVEHGLERRFTEAEFAAQRGHREPGVRQQLRGDPVGVPQQCAPGVAGCGGGRHGSMRPSSSQPVVTSPSPDSTASTLAWAASSAAVPSKTVNRPSGRTTS